MAIARSASGAAIPTTLTSPISSSDLLIDVVALTGTWPTTALGPFAVTLALGETTEERILVSSYTSTQLTVPAGGRGYDGTAAQSHDADTTATCTNDAASAQDAQQHIIDVTRDDHTQYVKRALYSTTGDILIATSAAVPARLAIGTTGQVLRVAGGVPAWQDEADEQTWTPQFYQNGNITSTVNYAKYVKVGKLIVANFNLTATANGSGGGTNPININVTSLPGTPDGQITAGPAIGSFTYVTSGGIYYTGSVFLTTSLPGGLAFTVAGLVILGINPGINANTGDTLIAHLAYHSTT